MRIAASVSSCLLLMPAALSTAGARTNRGESQPSAHQKQQRSLAKILLPNGSKYQCSESSQCASGCCVWNPVGNEVCGKKRWYKTCMEEDYTYVESTDDSVNTCAHGGGGDGDDTPASSTLRIMSYNLYLIFLASDGITALDDRAERIADWFASPSGDDYDVVMFQEAWLESDVIRDGMAAAGYCHYIYDDRGTFGSGMAVYSKFPIEKHDFRGYQNACGNPDCAVDKGVIYARINKNGRNIHLFGTHTMFSTKNHDVRRRQYDVMRTFIDEQGITSELVLLAGDFNEDKVNDDPIKFRNLLSDLNAAEMPNDANSPSFSYDPNSNSLIDPKTAGAESTQRALDYILYDTSANAVAPGGGSICEYLHPKDAAGNDLSDHYPMSCDIVLAD